MKKGILLIMAIVFIWPAVFAQNVGINDDGSDPDAAAMLDVKSANKGILIPRIDYNNKPATPPVGLMIFVTANGPEGNNAFYFYNGSSWEKLAGSIDSDWTVSGNDMYSAVSGNIGIGTTSVSASKLNVEGRIRANNGASDTNDDNSGDLLGSGGYWKIRTGANYRMGFDTYNTSNAWQESLSLTRNGNLGIGTSTPNVPLSLGTDFGDKIGLFDNGSLLFGFGLQTSLLQIYSGAVNTRIGLGYGSSTSFTETMSVVGDKVGILATAPSANLDVNGTVRFRNGAQDGYILTSDADGNATWSAPTAGDPSPSGWTVSGEDVYNSGSGNVGIGTTSPSTKLEVKAGTIAQNGVASIVEGDIDTNPSVWGATMLLQGATNTGTSSLAFGRAKVAKVEGITDASGAFGHMALYTRTSAGELSEKVRIDNNGNIGIGTTTPEAKLHVSGNTASAPTTLFGSSNIQSYSDSNSSWFVNSYFDGSGFKFLKDGKTAGIQISSGKISFRTPENDVAGTAGSAVGTVLDRITILPNGNVGIANDNPSYKLDVTGDINYSGTLYQDGSPLSVTGLWSTGTGNINYTGGKVGIGTTDPTAMVEVKTTGSAASLFMNRTDGALAGLSGGSNAGFVGTRTEHPLEIYTGESMSTKLFIEDDAGNGYIGIGTTEPSYNLHVENSDFAIIAAEATGGASDVETELASTQNYGFVGTRTNHPLKFRTNLTDRMTIGASGKIGIGTTDPSYMLHLEKEADAGSQSNLPWIQINNTSSGGTYSFAGFGFKGGDGAVTFDMFADGTGFFNSGTPNVYFRITEAYPILFGTSNSPRMTIAGDGKIGVGTTSPNFNMETATGNSNMPAINILTSTDPLYTHRATMGFGVDNGITTGFVIGRGQGNDNNFYIYDVEDSATRFKIDTNGKIGIGTDTPATTFDVRNNLDTSSDWYSNSNAGFLLYNSNANGDGIMKITGGSNQGRVVFGNGTSSDKLIFSSRQSGASTTEVVAVDNDGKLGVGTTAPQTTLDVEGTVSYKLATIAASTDAFNATNATVINVSTINGNVVIGGITGGVQGQVLHFYKSTGANTVTFQHNKTTGNQKIICPDATDIVLGVGKYGGITVVCSSTTWYVLGY